MQFYKVKEGYDSGNAVIKCSFIAWLIAKIKLNLIDIKQDIIMRYKTKYTTWNDNED